MKHSSVFLTLLWLLAITGVTPATHASSHDLIIYEVFPRNYSVKGGLKQVTDNIDVIQQTGVNTIWLMPIHPIGEVNRKGSRGSPYSVKDYFDVNPELGTLEDVSALLQTAHKRSLKVLIDFVPNHCAWDHTYVTNSKGWVETDWLGRPKPPRPEWSDVVQLDHGNPEVRAELEAIMAFWLSLGVDGFRVDVAGAVPDEFWAEVLPRLREQYPEAVFLAEADGPKFHGLGFDLSYDNALCNLMKACARGTKTAAVLQSYLAATQRDYQGPMLRFTENHDIPRTTSAFPDPLDEAFALLVFTLPGAPLLYAGQEAGLSDLPNLFEKDPVAWQDGDRRIETFYRQLCGMRTSVTALRRGSLDFLHHSHPDQVLAFTRQTDNTVLVVVNVSSETASDFTLHNPPQGEEGQLLPLFAVERTHRVPETLAPGDYFVWQVIPSR